MKTFLIILMTLFVTPLAHAQGGELQVGREAAARYFQPRTPAQSFNPESRGPSDHYLALSFGRYMSSQSYDWGKNGQEDDVGGNGIGVTYRIGEWYRSMDFKMRIDYQEFDVGGERPTKISFVPIISFPDASSKFPLYFGAGIGVGIFMKQVPSKSALSLDYQLIAGAQFLDIFENTGFFGTFFPRDNLTAPFYRVVWCLRFENSQAHGGDPD